MSNEDQQAKLKEIAEYIIRDCTDLISSGGMRATERYILRATIHMFNDSCRKILSATDALGGLDRKENAEILSAAMKLIDTSLQIGTMTFKFRAARKIVLAQQARVARNSRAPEQAKRRGEREALIRKHLPNIHDAKLHPSSSAESIIDALNAERRASGKRGVTTRTVQRWINELP